MTAGVGTVQKRVSPGKGIGICAPRNYRSLLWQVQKDSWGHGAGAVAGKEMILDSRPAVGSGLHLFTGRHWRCALTTPSLWKLPEEGLKEPRDGSPFWRPVQQCRVELQADTSRGGRKREMVR